MESKSDILSSVSSQHFEGNQVPPINLQQFLFQEHARNLSSIHSSNDRKNYPRIFTVAQTLKDPLILNNIKADYGSLGQFIGDINLSKDFLNQKKRKIQMNQDDLQQKKLRSAFKQKTQQELNTIYLSKTASTLQKKVAGKLLVQNLFKDSFGVPLSIFESQNVKPQPIKNYKINLTNIDDIFLGKKSSMTKVQLNAEKKIGGYGQSDSFDLKSSKTKRKQSKIWTKNQRSEILQIIKSKYPTLRKLQLKKQSSQYLNLMSKQEEDSQQSINSKRSSQKSNRVGSSHVIQVSQTNLKLQKLTIKPEFALHFLSQLQIEKLQEVNLFQIRIAQQTLSFMLQIFKTFCMDLTKLSLRCISIEKTDTIAIRIKQILQNISLKELILEYMDFQTKQFCVICLGVGSNTSLEYFCFDNNGVDQRACKSLELVSKHCENLKKISLRKNHLQPHHFSYFAPEIKLKIMI